MMGVPVGSYTELIPLAECKRCAEIRLKTIRTEDELEEKAPKSTTKGVWQSWESQAPVSVRLSLHKSYRPYSV